MARRSGVQKPKVEEGRVTDGERITDRKMLVGIIGAFARRKQAGEEIRANKRRAKSGGVG